ncbi:sensor histidine kinase [Aurantiacibacter suaedae]|uniref:sensor histidine kinase n=1 Tax=Aurantiacibacter suaedae TaxID=2545755 RepID=UPI003BA8C880
MASVTASTTPPKARANSGDDEGVAPADVSAEEAPAGEIAPDMETRNTGSIARRMMIIAAVWIVVLLAIGGFALDRALTQLLSKQFDEQLELPLTAMISSAEIDPYGDVWFNRPLADQRFLEPNSGFYYQINGNGAVNYFSRSLWDRTLAIDEDLDAENPVFYDSDQFPDESLRMVQRTVQIPGSDTQWQFVVAGSREELDDQLNSIRALLGWSFAVLGVGLFLMAVAQTWYGLSPLRRIRRAIASIRQAGSNRVTEPLPLEVQPMVQELNALLDHSQRQAEEARTHAGNLAHALKTPLTVLNNAARGHDPALDSIVLRESASMQRQVDHHLARARAVGRRAIGHSRSLVMESASAVERAVRTLYPEVRLDLAGNAGAAVSLERQDLEELLGNLMENAAKYGGGSVFVTVDARPEDPLCAIWIEDDGIGIPEAQRVAIFERGARLDTEKPGTGLGLAIVRDVAGIYGGEVSLGESEDLGGLLVELRLPRA